MTWRREENITMREGGEEKGPYLHNLSRTDDNCRGIRVTYFAVIKWLPDVDVTRPMTHSYA